MTLNCAQLAPVVASLQLATVAQLYIYTTFVTRRVGLAHCENQPRKFINPSFNVIMSVQEQIEAYLTSQPEPKRSEMQALHQYILQAFPACKLWYSDGKDDSGKVVSNPNIGYGAYTIKYADGSTKEFFQIGLSGNTAGISVYIMGIKDKTYLPQTYGDKIGKAKVTGYCIKFKSLNDINMEVLEAAMRYGVEASQQA